MHYAQLIFPTLSTHQPHSTIRSQHTFTSTNDLGTRRWTCVLPIEESSQTITRTAMTYRHKVHLTLHVYSLSFLSITTIHLFTLNLFQLANATFRRKQLHLLQRSTAAPGPSRRWAITYSLTHTLSFTYCSTHSIGPSQRCTCEHTHRFFILTNISPKYRLINVTDGQTASDCLEPMLPLDVNEARRDAARQLVGNRERVVPFAMRALGDLGDS